MSAKKRNAWLEDEESSGEEFDYQSEEESRAHVLNASKRRKLDHSSASEGEDDQEDPLDIDHESGAVSTQDASKSAELKRLEAIAATLPRDLKLASGTLTTPLSLSSKPRKDKSGVIYLSRVPPFMKPNVLRSQLAPYGDVGRIFLTPESSTQRSQRLKSGGTRRKLFLDGWVEFSSKKDAKFVADNLNAQTMGGKKRSRWHDEVWNIRYLNRVKWADLVEQIQNENAERVARLRQEIAKDKKENARFLENVERGKMIGGIEAKRKEREDQNGQDNAVHTEAAEVADQSAKRQRKSHFEQRGIKVKAIDRSESRPEVQRVLSGIF